MAKYSHPLGVLNELRGSGCVDLALRITGRSQSLAELKAKCRQRELLIAHFALPPQGELCSKQFLNIDERTWLALIECESAVIVLNSGKLGVIGQIAQQGSDSAVPGTVSEEVMS
ncbi:hypothetical protein AB4254_08350 [Vibrio breoganii]